MSDILRPQPSAVADALWSALRKAGRHGMTPPEADEAGIASAPYARRRMRLWAGAGFLVEVEGDHGMASKRYRIAKGAPHIAPAITTAGEVISLSAMSAAEFSAIRRKLALTEADMGIALGWTGVRQNCARRIRRIEAGERVIDQPLADKARALLKAKGAA